MGQNDVENVPDISPETYEARKRIVFELTTKFNIERYVYLIISILSFLLIIYLAFDLYKQQKISFDQLALFLGPSGFLAYAISRILYMWSKSIKIIFTGKF